MGVSNPEAYNVVGQQIDWSQIEASDYSSTFNQYVGGGLYAVGSYAYNTGVYLFNNPIEAVHLGLDGLGLTPFVGEIADIANAALYAIRGRFVEAGTSSLAAIPYFGYFAASGQMYGFRINALCKNDDSQCALVFRTLFIYCVAQYK